ncbi:MAG: PVC-type heme-binding CxxCH protein [Planctomycetota bacterium]
MAQPVKLSSRAALCLWLLACTSLVAQRPPASDGFEPLADGKTFDGWNDQNKVWRLEDGAFVAGKLDVEFPRNEFLSTRKEYGDFELRLEYKVLGHEGFVNGGVQFRSRRIENNHEMIGYQADLGAGYDGYLYDESRRNRFLTEAAQEVIQAVVKKGDWNRYRIRAQGRRIELWVNGLKTVDYVETDKNIPLKGLIAVQVHGAGKVKVHYRKLEIRELTRDAPKSTPSQLDASHLRKDLVGYWSFDGHANSPKPVDLKGTLHGDASYADSPFGKSLSVKGSGYAVVPRHESMNVKDGAYSVAAWIRARDLRQAGFVCLGRYAWVHGWYFDMPHPNGVLRLETVRPERRLNGKLETKPGTISANEWTHIAFSADRRAGKAALYVNGFVAARGTIPPIPLDNPSVSLHFGRIEGSRLFNGDIDEVYFFRRTLEANEIQALVERGRKFAKRPSNLAASVRRFGKSRSADVYSSPFENRTFSLRTGDVVAFTGQTDVVRSRFDGTLEAELFLRYGRAKPRFRNMAWEGDTVFEQWRDIAFGTWSDQFAAIDARVIFAQFGQIEALLPNAEDVTRFASAYESLLDEFSAQTARIVLVSPRPFESPALPHFPDHSGKNELIAKYASAIQRIAEKRNYIFIDLVTPIRSGRLAGRLTKNGVHLTPEAQPRIAAEIARQLGVLPKVLTANQRNSLLQSVREKNRLWFDNWRPMNWAFAFGDRTSQPFSRPHGDRPPLRVELEQFKPLVDAADREIASTCDAIAKGVSIPKRAKPTRRPPPPGVSTPEQIAKEIAAFQAMKGLEVGLFASEGDGVVNPLQMRWDNSNRLWVLCAPTYPHIDPGERPRDYVLVCEDTNGDGRADRFHRFAEDLFMPQGIEFGNGGVYIAEATELVHLRDRDGDGEADTREVILSGFGTADSHQLINGLAWGPNGALWFTQGHHVYSHVETPWGISKLHKAGVWRYRPRTGQLHAFFNLSTAGLNCQSVDFDDYGQVFHNSAALSEGFYAVPGMVPTSNPRRYWSLSPPKPRNTGIEIIGTTHLPKELQGSLIFSGYISNNVQLRQLVDENSGFATKAQPELVTSPRLDFRPVSSRVGPDGAIYVCDWYNPIIGHYQASYRDPRRDKTHGRIWRFVAKGRALAEPVDVNALSIAQLLDAQRSPERLVRRNAQRRLFELPTNRVVKALEAWVAGLDPSSSDYERLVLFAVGVFEAHEVVRPQLVTQLLEAKDPRVRAYGARVVGNWGKRLERPLELLRKAARDEHPRVRLESVVACNYVGSPHAIEVATEVLDRPTDRFIEYALKQTVVALKTQWYPALARGELRFGGRIERLRFVLETDGSRDISGFVRKLALSSSITSRERSSLYAVLADIGSVEDLDIIWTRSTLDTLILAALARASEIHGKSPSTDVVPRLRSLLEMKPTRAAALRLVGTWKRREFNSVVQEALNEKSSTTGELNAAIRALASLNPSNAIETLSRISTSKRPLQVRTTAVASLVPLDLERAARSGAAILAEVKTPKESAACLSPFLERKNATARLAAALRAIRIQPDPAKLAHRALSTAGRSDEALLAALNDAIGIEAIDRPYSETYVRDLSKQALANGDATRGREVFFSTLANCTGCHRVGDTGGTTGPDLSAIGAGRSAELLTESILFPNRQIREGYMSKMIVTKDGRVITGYPQKDDGKELHVRDTSTNQLRRISKSAVISEEDAGSVMPKGVTSSLTQQELLDLIRFVSQLGRATK